MESLKHPHGRPNDWRSGKRDGKKGFSPETLKLALEGIPAEERSRRLEFKRAWVQRMRERGIKPW